MMNKNPLALGTQNTAHLMQRLWGLVKHISCNKIDNDRNINPTMHLSVMASDDVKDNTSCDGDNNYIKKHLN